ncbi:Cna B-type domain-containing protein [Streptococcus ruminantium]|uniref:Cna B-type domain-containing protein n=1 Tax=Streptococcus ruminantium TaxID=1917441 RepID=UPI001F22A046|nr:Cna B-type domain-containing protein [Streptococcus ruminantium]BDD43194.1 cell wall anchor [Streptococcus ruminantium]
MTKLRNLLLILLVLFGGIFSVQAASAKSVDIEVSNTNLTPEVVEGGNSTRFSFDFTVPNGTKKDDTTTISLPKELDFQRYQEFEVYAPDGQAVAKAVIEPKIKTLTMTYTDYVEKHSDIKGHLEMNVVVDRKVVTTANTVAAEITINNKTKITIGTGKLSYTGTKGDSDKIDFWKYGVSSNNNEIVYLININTSKSTVPDVTISDQLKSPGLQYVEDSFEIQEGNWYKNEWNYWALGSEINVTSKYKDKIEISSDKTSFKVKLGDINGKGYRIKYRVKAAYTLINGEKLNNLAEYYTGTTRRSHASHVQTYQGASGSASGYNYGLIIEKVNEERQLLAGAEFTVTRTATGQVIGKFMTDEKGIVEVTGLLRDEYTITETKAPAGYAIAAPVTRIADNSIVTIIDKKANTDIEGKKTWVDNNDQDGKRPKSIKVNLLANGTIVQTKEVTAENDWSYKFSGLDQHDKDGEKIVYTVSEEKVDGYEMKVEGTNITNTHTPETTQVSGTKTWNDNNDQDGKRPKSITVNLLADGKVVQSQEVTAANNWKYTFTDLPKYANGKEIVYTVTENAVEGYTTTYDKYNITNSYTPGQTSLTVTKAWDDKDNQDGKRPEAIQVQLYANGEKLGEPVTLTADNKWTHTWTGLAKKANKKDIVYTVKEVSKVEGYTTTVGTVENGNVTITNTYEPSTTSIKVNKVWKDNNNQDGLRPTSITVNLLADGEVVKTETITPNADGDWSHTFTDLPEYKNGKKITYTVSEEKVEGYETKVEGTTITNTHTPETTEVAGTKTWNDNNDQDGKRPKSITVNLLADGQPVASKIVTADDNWAYKFSNLPAKKNGAAITYTISEKAVADYTTTYDGYNITNSYTPGETSVTATKVWEDNNNQDGLRREIKLELYADGVATGQVQTLSEENNWKATWTGLAKKANKKDIVYTVKEVTAIDGYTSKVTQTSTNNFTITNTHTPETAQVAGAKTWNDNNDQDGKRPKSITVNLLADGKVIKSQQVTAENDWKYTFTDLPKYANGKEIVYTVSEEKVDGYEMKVDGYNITNSYTPSTTSVKVNKVWKDKDNQDGLRPTSIIVNLLADGQVVSTTTIKPDTNGNWNYTFTDLPEYKNGKKIAYTVEEANTPNGYTSSVEGTTITNTHTPETTEVAGTKTWNDNNDQDGKRPKSITVNLLANGEVVQSQKVTADNNWTYTFTNLPKYANGKEIVYTVTENAVDNYTTTIDGHNITNSYTPGQTSLTVTKIWKDNNNQDGKRPGSIQVQLYANGEKLGEPITLTADNKWTHTWTGLDKKANQKDIVYTVKEVSVVDGYTASVGKVENGNVTITNTYKPTTPPKKKKSTPLPSTGSLSGLGLTLVGLALAATISARAIYRKRK